MITFYFDCALVIIGVPLITIDDAHRAKLV